MRAATELSFSSNGIRLIAEMDCSEGPSPLDTGKIGWRAYSREIDWHLGWKFRFNASVTEPSANYPSWYAARAIRQNESGSIFPLFIGRDDDDVATVIKGRTLKVIFELPDCLDHFRKGGWGASGGGPVLVGDKKYHCQARVVARPPSPSWGLQWEYETGFKRHLLFVNTAGLPPQVVDRFLVQRLPDADTIAMVRRTLGQVL